MNLQLKPGTQIMFIKNDKGEVRRYYNGKIGTVSKIEKDKIFIAFPGETDILLEKETWKNIRYRYNNEKDSIEEEELGSFTQYPIRLAWAITIHKSQGLTFEKAIIDAGASFAAGQVYVALSRLTSLNGLILYSRIYPESIHTHPRIIAFAETEEEEAGLDMQLEKEQKLFVTRSLLQAFNCRKLSQRMEQHYEAYEHRQVPDKNKCITWAERLLSEANALQEVSEKFNRQLTALLTETETGGYDKLHQRVNAASAYFSGAIGNMLNMVKEHIHSIKSLSKVKKYLKELDQLDTDLVRKKLQIEQALKLSEGLIEGVQLSELLLLQQQQSQVAVIKETPVVTKPQKGDSHRQSLSLHQSGKTIQEIAAARGLSVSTIEGHLASFISTGEIRLEELLSKEKIDSIRQAIAETGATTSSAIREKLGNACSYGEIRMVLAGTKRKE
ncbi:MAG: helix-turn-helix domain-containing protein [Chitinophagaceae bacterium]|nr:helix-turn-helix domain-containing protein [Chitinophagaceae bacterium]